MDDIRVNYIGHWTDPTVQLAIVLVEQQESHKCTYMRTCRLITQKIQSIVSGVGKVAIPNLGKTLKFKAQPTILTSTLVS